MSQIQLKGILAYKGNGRRERMKKKREEINERMDMNDLREIFYEALEQGGPDMPKGVQKAWKSIGKAYDDYSSMMDFYYFSWGYQLGLERGKAETGIKKNDD